MFDELDVWMEKNLLTKEQYDAKYSADRIDHHPHTNDKQWYRNYSACACSQLQPMAENADSVK